MNRTDLLKFLKDNDIDPIDNSGSIVYVFTEDQLVELVIQSRRELPTEEDYKAKYEKCIDVIKRFDAGIIGMYDL